MKILVWRDKYGNINYPADTKEQLHKSALQIVLDRKERGYFYDDAEAESDKILEAKDGEAAMNFLQDRDDEGYEYEGISIEYMKDVSDF